MSDQEPYMDVYHLVKGAPRGFEEYATSLEGPDPGVHFACRLLGPYNHLTIVTEELGDVTAARGIISSLDEEREDGRPYDSTTAVAYEFLQVGDDVLRPKRNREAASEPVRPEPPPGCKPHEVFAPMWVTPGMLGAVFAGLATVPRLMGCALTYGGFDVLIELGAETFADLRASLDAVRDIVGGGARMEPCFVTW